MHDGGFLYIKKNLTYIKIKEFLIHYWFWIWINVELISFVLGYIGFAKALESKSNTGVLDYLYYSIKLATFESLPDLEEENLYIKISKLTAPASIFMISAGAVYFLLLNKFLILKLRRYKNHVIIFGLGHMGMIFLKQKIRERRQIVVILREEENMNADNLLELGIPVVYGNPSEDIVLERARISYASEIYIVSDDDILNVAVANKILKLRENSNFYNRHSNYTKDKHTHICSSSNSPTLTCSVHIHDYEFKRSIEKEEWVKKVGGNVNLMIFNIYEMTARYVVKDIPIEPEGESVLTIEKPWVLIIGLGNMGYALLRQLIRMKVYPKDKKLRITILDNNAKRHEEILLSMYYDPKDRTKFIFKNVELSFIEKDLKKIHSIHDLFEQTTERLPQVISICAEDDALTNIITNKIKLSLEELYEKRQLAKEIKIIAFFRNTIFGSCKEDDIECMTKNELIRIHNINIIDKGCSSFMELSEIDLVAKMIHSHFFIETFRDYLISKSSLELENLKRILDNHSMNVFEKEAEIRKAFSAYVEQWIQEKPSRKEWQQLDEDFKNSNRLQADHLIDKLKVLNPKFTLSTDPREVESVLKHEEKIEILAELEHKRYCAERKVLLEKKDFEEYQDLEEGQKKWNRDIVRNIPNILSAYQQIKGRGEERHKKH